MAINMDIAILLIELAIYPNKDIVGTDEAHNLDALLTCQVLIQLKRMASIILAD